jgi:Fe2+ or Zn2+ uptake regulation protein
LSQIKKRFEDVCLDKYVKLLRNHKIKVTPQRLEILRYLDKNKIHPNADEIYNDLKKKNPALSRTTVYNTLDKLRENNLLQVLTISENELRFDSIINPHHHFLCKKCGEITDIKVKCPYLEDILKGGHRIDEVHGYFKGVCEDCLKGG